jgi:hypothetical protein
MSNKPFSKRIVICGSMSSFALMKSINEDLLTNNVNSIIPDEELDIHQNLNPENFEEFKRLVSFRYLRKIKDLRTYAVLAINPEKHKIVNYIGPNTFAEIAIAFAHSKKIFILNGFPEIYEEELSSWGAIPLKGDIQKLINEYLLSKSKDELQLNLFSLHEFENSINVKL